MNRQYNFTNDCSNGIQGKPKQLHQRENEPQQRKTFTNFDFKKNSFLMNSKKQTELKEQNKDLFLNGSDSSQLRDTDPIKDHNSPYQVAPQFSAI